MKNTLLCSLASFCLAPLLLAVSAHAESPSDSYDWTPAKKEVSTNNVSVTGRVVPQDGAMSVESARVQGRVVSLMKREGEKVKEGDSLFEVSSAECISLQEEKRLAASHELAELTSSTDKREKQLGIKLVGDHCYLVASHAGVVTKRNAESGATFNQGDPLATILDLSRLTVELDLPEKDQMNVHVGQPVTLQFASRSGKELTGKVESIVPTIDATARTSKARVSNVHLPVGTSLESLVYGQIRTSESGYSLNIPSSALVFAHNQQYVVAKLSNKATPVAVTVIGESGSNSSVRPLKTNALKENDLVASRGAPFLYKQLTSEVVP